MGCSRRSVFEAVACRSVGCPRRLDRRRTEWTARHLPTNIRPLLLADRGFGRASLIQLLQAMPNHTGYPVDYVIRLKGDVVVQSADWGRLRDYPYARSCSGPKPFTDGAVVINLILYWARGQAVVPGYLPDRKMYRRRMQPEQYFRDGKQRFGLSRSTVTTTHRLQRLLVALLLACCLLILAGMRASPTFRNRCAPGANWASYIWAYYLATPDPPDRLHAIKPGA